MASLYTLLMKYVTLLLLLLIVGCKTHTVANETANQVVNSTIDSVLKNKNIPGLSYSIIYKNGKTESYTRGFSDVENKIKLNNNHTFFSGSIGKTYAVAVLMPLIESGKIDLNKTFISYFPEIDWLSQLPNIDAITIKMLLQHTSGLPRYVLRPEIWKALHNNPDKVWNYKERLSVIFNTEPLHKAGKAYAYSDTNYILIGMLIEKITAKDYYVLVQNQLIVPYNLKQTYPSVQREIPNLAVGYSKMPPVFQVSNKTVTDGKYCFNPQLEWTGGGMASTTSNLAKWAKIYYEGRLFLDSTLQQITTVNAHGEHAEGKNNYGMGTFIYDTKYGTAYGHSGFMPGFNSLFIYYPKIEVAAAIQINCDYAASVLNMNTLIDDLVSQSIKE
ncbi:serine hydrolase domain-containing protein [Lacinutrix chionoecetis]